MRLANAQDTNITAQMVSEFLGYNAGLRQRDGEFADEEGLTADYYPVLSPRARRGKVAILPADIQCFFVYEKNHYYISGGKFKGGAHEVTLTAGTKQLVRMGANAIIFPDGLVYNLADDTYKWINAEHTSTEVTDDHFVLCKKDGAPYTDIWEGTTEPDPDTYSFWLDTSSDPVVLKQWSENESAWVSVPTTYVKIESDGIGASFNEDDAITISGCSKAEWNDTHIIQAVGEDYIVVIGILDTAFTSTTRCTYSRTMPQMDYVCEHNNRLWGCSSDSHEIYSCKLGDPTNWNYFGGLASDSYAASVGTDGAFTGCIAHLGYILFFKDKGAHRLYGSQPSNFQMDFVAMRGVQEGSHNSLVVLNEYLYYKSRNGICVYDGSTPRDISTGFGTEKYFDATCGAYDDKLYVSMRDAGYEWYIFVYDTRMGIWHKHKGKLIGFYGESAHIYMIDDKGTLFVSPKEELDNYLFPNMEYPSDLLLPNMTTAVVSEEKTKWFAETGELGLDNPYYKYISRIVLRLVLEEGSTFKVEVMYDSSGIWEELFNLIATGRRSYTMPVKVQRCDHLKLRLSGEGDIKIYSLSKCIETGTEMGESNDTI